MFEGKAVWNDEKYRHLQGTFPVIFMGFALVKTGEITGIKTAVKKSFPMSIGTVQVS